MPVAIDKTETFSNNTNVSYISLNKKFLEYCRSAFLPLILWWIPIILVFGWGGILMLITGEFLLGLYELGIVLFPIPFLILAYFADKASKTMLIRGLIIYSLWFIIALVTYFVFLTAIGGVSMAIVDNPNNGTGRSSPNINFSLNAVLFAQPILLVLTAIGVYRIKKRRFI